MPLSAARLVGAMLRTAFAAILLVRRPRPIHSNGLVLSGEITWLARSPATGIAWIDESPREPVPVIARLSRSVGLPTWLPDVIGLALRVEAVGAAGDRGRPVDLELASTGFGVPSRFLLAPHRRASRARLGTLLPYRSERGPVLVGARTFPARELPVSRHAVEAALAREPWRVRLYAARPTGKWHAFADVELRPAEDPDDTGLRFDSVRHALPGARIYDWHRALHQPSYRLTQDEALTRFPD